MALSQGQRSVLLRLLVVVIAAGALLLAFRGVDWREMLTTIQRARFRYIALACLISTASYTIRGLRWRVLLSAEKTIPPGTVFWANMIGYLGNSFLPARAGEVIRSALLGQRAGISKSFVFATALTERIMDVVALVLISLVAAVSIAGVPLWLTSTAKVTGAIAVAGSVALYLAARSHARFAALLSRLPLPITFRARLAGVTEQFLNGARAIHHPSRALSFTAMAAAIWMMDALSSVVMAKALSLDLTVPQAFILLAALGLASALPSTPGAVGIFQLVAVTILIPFGFSRDSALAYILVAQAFGYLVITIWGTIGIWQLGARGAKVTPVEVPEARQG
jgi:uncharacterized protein (TIRG00374 family)